MLQSRPLFKVCNSHMFYSFPRNLYNPTMSTSSPMLNAQMIALDGVSFLNQIHRHMSLANKTAIQGILFP